MNCIPTIMLRIVFALGGMRMSRASSTARSEATAWTTVHTPQMRCANAQASRGSRPCSTSSRPRNCVHVAHASATIPFSACASMRRCPSMRVIGSTTSLVLAMSASPQASGRPRSAADSLGRGLAVDDIAVGTRASAGSVTPGAPLGGVIDGCP